MSGVIWDGIWAGGGPNGDCNASEHTAFWDGANQSVYVPACSGPADPRPPCLLANLRLWYDKARLGFPRHLHACEGGGARLGLLSALRVSASRLCTPCL